MPNSRTSQIDSLVSEYNWTDVPCIQTLDLHAPGVEFVDVRSPAEFAVSSIEGARSLSAFERNGVGQGTHTVVLFCTIGARSAQYARAFKGNVRVFNYAGSILRQSHLDPLSLVVPDNVDVARGPKAEAIHCYYGDTWDLAQEGFEVVKFSQQRAKAESILWAEKMGKSKTWIQAFDWAFSMWSMWQAMKSAARRIFRRWV